MEKFLALCLSDAVSIMKIIVKMTTTDGILKFMSMIFLCSVELSMEKFYNQRVCFHEYLFE